ncbi:acetyl-CoA carboxylase carboxyltransferase subunit alpha [Clostridium niameyense]|uniref:Acetyl-coenzyme A carboxylase carboxyl transferase subunit alpha n=1 Tax=Clostridium niameyense TaxID=1622073 RepID=A0A6M0RBJ9_9CLOT|nr:acetyl-CoA carboxylase carboxyltransferase subunit alpha [Clostridium niameyense]NEZ47634.1 acetyl-CoA carboxylase carboxyltransferase subunit alpha [Clostridium niameyense]
MQIKKNKKLIHNIKKYKVKSAWDKVTLARLKERPTALEYIKLIFQDFIEFHGDRNFSDDKSIICGIGLLNNTSVTIIAQQKGRNTKENIERNFGMPKPEGYRKAIRIMKQAEKFKRPIICFIDTPGAFCGVDAEERGQGEAIARNLLEMSRLRTPIISLVIGEGGSGGALALGVADRVLMLENSIYSILSPEGFSSILWKDASRAKEAAEVMKITSENLKEFGVIDDIIEEPFGGAHKNSTNMAQHIKEVIINEINILKNYNMELLLQERYDKFRNIGMFME